MSFLVLFVIFRVSAELFKQKLAELRECTEPHLFFRAVGIVAGPPWRPAVDAGSPDTAAPSASIAIGRPATTRLATICRHANREDQPRVARRGSPPRISQRMSMRSTPRRYHPPESRRGSDVAVLGTSDRPDRSTTSRADRTFAQRLSSVKNA